MSDISAADVPPARLQRIIRLRDLSDYCGLRRTAVEDLIKAGRFPKPVRLGERSMGWMEADLIRWQQERIAERDGVDNSGQKAANDKSPRP